MGRGISLLSRLGGLGEHRKLLQRLLCSPCSQSAGKGDTPVLTPNPFNAFGVSLSTPSAWKLGAFGSEKRTLKVIPLNPISRSAPGGAPLTVAHTTVQF